MTFLPAHDAALEVTGADARSVQARCNALADFVPMRAIHGDRPIRAEIPRPPGDIAWLAPHRRDQHSVVRVESRVAAYIDDKRRRGGAELLIKHLCGNEKTAFVHVRAPRGASGAELGRMAV